MRPKKQGLVQFVVVGVFVAVMGCAAGCSRQGGTVDKSALNVVLITLDQVRADRLEQMIGATNSLTPVMAELAHGGIFFEDMQAVAPLTVTAHASILTGLEPPEHGLQPGHRALLPPGNSLAIRLRAAGYQTAAFVANDQLTSKQGFDAGFELFDAAAGSTSRLARAGVHLQPRATPQRPGSGLRRGQEVTDAALAWLHDLIGVPADKRAANDVETATGKKNARTAGADPAAYPKATLKKPFFLWLQLSDIGFRDSAARVQVRGRALDSYDTELAYMDTQLGRIMKLLDQTGLRDQTLVVLTSAHGIALGEGAGADAGLTTDDDTLHIPAIFNLRRLPASGTRCGTIASQSNLTPTILELVTGQSAQGGSHMAGRSLTALLLQKMPPEPGDDAQRVVYYESLWPAHAYGLPARQGWTSRHYRYQRGGAVVARRTPIGDAAERKSASGGRAAADMAATSRPTSEAAEEILVELEKGFAAVPVRVNNSPLPQAGFTLPEGWDREEFVALWQTVAQRLQQPGMRDEALLADCQRLVEGWPENAQFQTWLGMAHAGRRQLAEAVAAQRRALELAPDAAYIRSNLGLAFLDAGDLPNAIDKLEDAYLASPEEAEYRDNLAAVLMNTGLAFHQNKDYNNAMACMTRVLYLQPSNPVAHVNIGKVYLGMQRKDMAEASYRKALELNPRFRPAQRALDALKERK